MNSKMIDDPNALDQYIDLLGEEAMEFIIELIDTLLAGAPESFRSLDQSLAENDPPTFRRAAHTLKTVCLTVGAKSLADKFRVLEDKGEAGDLSSADQLLESCKPDFNQLEQELIHKKGDLS